jgi:hypothetical protein
LTDSPNNQDCEFARTFTLGMNLTSVMQFRNEKKNRIDNSLNIAQFGYFA